MRTRFTIAAAIGNFALMISAITPAEEFPLRVPVSAQQAWQAVVEEFRVRGFQDGQLPHVEDIDLPVAVPVRGAPNLRVSSLCWDQNTARARFRLECRETGACLPFLVYVRTPLRAPSAPCRMDNTSPHASRQKSSSVVHAGDRATAVLLAAGLRMTTKVHCLDRGAAGDIIRVRGPEGRIFRARVSGPALVEAQLP